MRASWVGGRSGVLFGTLAEGASDGFGSAPGRDCGVEVLTAGSSQLASVPQHADGTPPSGVLTILSPRTNLTAELAVLEVLGTADEVLPALAAQAALRHASEGAQAAAQGACTAGARAPETPSSPSSSSSLSSPLTSQPEVEEEVAGPPQRPGARRGRRG